MCSPPGVHAGLPLPAGLTARLRPPLGPAILRVALGLLTLATLAAAALIVGRHLQDRHGISHVHGAWLALADRAAHGDWYPPPFDGQSYAGTRFMPLGIGVLAGALRVAGDPLLASKLAAAFTTLALFAVLAWALVQAGLPRAYAACGGALVLLTSPGIYALTAYRGDVLPVALQVWAVALIAGHPSPNPRRYAAAGLLSALAVLSKLSALWAGGAIGLVALAAPRRAFLPFAAATLSTLALGLSGAELLSSGHFFENILGLSGSGLAGGLKGAPGKLHYLWVESSLLSWALLPVVLYGFWSSLARGRLELVQLAFLMAGVLALVILADAGTYANHLLDLVVLSVWLSGRVLADELATPGPRAVPALLSVTVLVAGLAGLDRAVADDLRAPRVEARDPLAAVVTGPGPYLSEDATIPILRGERPLVLDAWMFLRYAAHHPEAEAHLLALIEQRQLRQVVLLRDPLGPGAEEWYRVQAFGPRVIAAILQHYQAALVVEGYHVFVPRTPAP